MICDYKQFIDILMGKDAALPTLFEPFIPRSLVEQLIWRRGDTVWQTPEARIDALVSLRERTRSDVIPLDLREDSSEIVEALLAAAETRLPVGSALVAMIDCDETLSLCEAAASVCAIASETLSHRSNKPFIRLGGTLDAALAEQADGYFAFANAEEMMEQADGRITILGGLGATYLEQTGPASICKRCDALMANPRYILGSGGGVKDYLGLIAMLGAYGRRRR